MTFQPAARRTARDVVAAESGAPHGLPIGMVSFLFTDVEGSTRLWQHYRDTMAVALARHDELIEQLVARHDGTLVRPRGEGDSRFAVFVRASDAVAAACAIQIALVQQPWPMAEPLRVRIAVHTGEADLRSGDYYGPAVNHCARLRSAAHGGQLLISAVTADLVGEALAPAVTLRDLGDYRLKDLERPERILQVLHPDLPANFPPLLSQVANRNNLTAQATPLIGREQELTEVQRRLLEPGVRVLTLTGPGGVGKTRLALQAAADMLEHFADGVFVVPLAAIRDATLVVPSITQILGGPELSGMWLQPTLHSFLRDKSLLLVLDSFEQVLPAAVSIAELARACPSLKVLVTSRAPLRVYGEQEISVPPLRVPSAPWPPPEQLSQYDAVRLLVERAQAIRSDFAITNATAPAIAAICARLDGLPLAIELAAARFNLLTPDALLARLNQQLDVLIGGPRDQPAHHQTLSGTIQWSFDLLDAREQALFRRLGVFEDGCALDAAEVVCAGEQQSPLEVLNGLGTLVDQSLLQREAHSADEPRLNMLEAIREFALERLIASGEVEVIRRRHVDYFVSLGERAAPELSAGAEHAIWMNRLDRDRHNLRAALLWCVENGEVDRGLQLGGAVWRYWSIQASPNEARDWQQALIRLLPGAGRTPLRARALMAAGVLASQQGDYATAHVLLEESLSIGRELNDHERIASSLHNLGALALRDGNTGLAQRLLEEAVDHSRAGGVRRREALSLNFLGGVLAERADYASARARHGESAEVYRDLGDKSGVAYARSRQGFAALADGDLAMAQTLCEEGLQLARESGDRGQIAWSAMYLAFVRLQQAAYADARQLFGESLQLWDSGGAGVRIALALEGLASVAAAVGQPERALHLFGAAAAFQGGGRWWPVYSVPSMGQHLIPTEHWQALAAASLGEQRAAEALSAGRALAVEHAIAYALQTAAPAQL